MKAKVTLEIETDEDIPADKLHDAVADWLDGLEHGDFTLWIADPEGDPNEATAVVIKSMKVI